MDKTLRAVIPGSRLFNTLFGVPRNGENITRSLGSFQSGYSKLIRLLARCLAVHTGPNSDES